MYVLYTDESGKDHNPRDNVVVIGGIGVHEDAVRPLAGTINGILNAHIGRGQAADLEIHARDMNGGGRGRWRRISTPKRLALMNALLELVGGWKHEGSNSLILPFGVIVDRGRTETPVQTGYAELLHAFDKQLRDKRKVGDAHNCVLIADRGQYEQAITSWVEAARSRPRGRRDRRRLHALVEPPFFIDSASTRLMQLADLVCYALYRAYNVDDWLLADHVHPCMRGDQGVLIHLADRDGCTCVACGARPGRRARPRARSRAVRSGVLRPQSDNGRA